MSLTQLSEHLWEFRDTCNVFVLQSGDEGLLIDAGSAAVLPHLRSIGIKQVSWVLHTHHHRDQCWGTPTLQKTGAKVAVPEFERHLFDNVEAYWQSRRIYDNYNNSSAFFSLGENIHVDALLEDYEIFSWKEYDFLVLPAKGHTYGMVSLVTIVDGKKIAFTGDLMSKGGKLYQLHAMEYSYGDLLGVELTMQSILALKNASVELIYPSHGAPITDVASDIEALESHLEQLAGVGKLHTAGRNNPFADTQTIRESKLVPISEHLLWAGPYTSSNFYIVLSGAGHAMLIDYGFVSLGHVHWGPEHDTMQALRFVEHHLDQLRETFGVRHIELVVPTHIHDDHVSGIPYLQRHFGTKCWALDCVAEVIVDPAAWASAPCCYHKPIDVERILSDGETFEWRGFSFEIYYTPGHTEQHALIVGTIDGKRVAFGGDNLLLFNPQSGGIDREIASQSTVLRNGLQLDMFRRCASVIQATKADLLCPGHGDLVTLDGSKLAEYTDYLERATSAITNAVNGPEDQSIDLFWIRMLPYLSSTAPGGQLTFTLKFRNNLGRKAAFSARLLPAFGWNSAGETETILLRPGGRGEISLKATAPSQIDTYRRLISAEVLIDGVSQGPICEALVAMSTPQTLSN
ncbi:MBL fold metallo-hydrolase [Mesorhizobium sp.]|uniref:MBL fold metallo-hydrolase n=1 Tax=Mesorhizobium sp. TaxID=1871066 RepID=UPI000FE3B3F1|nr:MBL fold metallo-hydrolase [Mesorhizobium sp.]RWN50293.1 MAG: MBL fold metallo-hydrolase [Mesorhizobium sp.]RWN70680.1 MAG: MBL fold metallo-hydrolase [Mesorhizobium sp.]RWN71308.1 MAG: MBL fold metallo-hydrolase [Mesorhizobium sp.]RWN82305.1 MAG: MBL fold metallo-hydrolase [Mesorhizobium sp.]RWO06753.1 MAG: MBL fold metallo-hydrolase [Mesorhizobium sp.]